jgi:thymidylate synthase (FAD)
MSQIKVELQETMGSDRSIAEAAWTSSLDYQKKQSRSDSDVERVVKMLADNKHSTPFESVIFKFWIKLPIAIDRQHMTHRIGSHNGMSGRYRTMPNEWLCVPDDIDDIIKKVDPDLGLQYNLLCDQTNIWYFKALETLKENEKKEIISNKEYKRLREFFRGVLPQHNMTERVTIFNLRSFANYQKLRNSPHAQPEIRQIAQLMLEEVKKSNIAPIAIEWLEKNNWDI